MLKQWLGYTQEDRLQEKLRQYIDGEFTPEEHEQFLQEIKTSPELRAKLERLQFLVQSLQSIPKHNPPARLWDSISKEINQTAQQQYRLTGLFANPLFYQTARALPIVLALTIAGYFVWNYTASQPEYRVVSVEDIKAYEHEVNAYMVHHDVSYEPVAARESLIALYTFEKNDE